MKRLRKIYDELDDRYGVAFHLVFFTVNLCTFLCAVYLFTILIGMPV